MNDPAYKRPCHLLNCTKNSTHTTLLYHHTLPLYATTALYSALYNYLTDPVSQGCSINTFVIHSFIHYFKSSFSSKSSRQCLSQTVRAGELDFWENVHPPPCVTCHEPHVKCHVSCVRCHMSGVTCHVSGVKCNYYIYIFFWKVVECVLSMGPPHVVNRPGVAGAVLYTASSYIHSLIHKVILFLQIFIIS